MTEQADLHCQWKARAKTAEAALQLIIEEWNSQGRLVDTFTSDKMNAVIDNAVFVLSGIRRANMNISRTIALDAVNTAIRRTTIANVDAALAAVTLAFPDGHDAVTEAGTAFAEFEHPWETYSRRRTLARQAMIRCRAAIEEE